MGASGDTALKQGPKDGHRIQSRGYYLWVSYRQYSEITAWIGTIVTTKAHRKWRTTYDTKLIQKGQCGSPNPTGFTGTIIPENVKVKNTVFTIGRTGSKGWPPDTI